MIFIFNFKKVYLVFWVWDDDVVRFLKKMTKFLTCWWWKKKKKNGAHKHRSLFSKNFASKYSRHVVLCKYSNSNNKKIKNKTYLINAPSILLFENPRRTFKTLKRKKRSTQTSLALLKILCVKIFTSCCLMQKLAKNNQTKK